MTRTFIVTISRTMSIDVTVEADGADAAVTIVGRHDFPLPPREEWTGHKDWSYDVHEQKPEHDPMCTECDHVCVRARRGPNPTRLIALGAEMCRFCDDHDEAIHEGYGDTPCTCPDHQSRMHLASDAE